MCPVGSSGDIEGDNVITPTFDLCTFAQFLGYECPHQSLVNCFRASDDTNGYVIIEIDSQQHDDI